MSEPFFILNTDDGRLYVSDEIMSVRTEADTVRIPKKPTSPGVGTYPMYPWWLRQKPESMLSDVYEFTKVKHYDGSIWWKYEKLEKDNNYDEVIGFLFP